MPKCTHFSPWKFLGWFQPAQVRPVEMIAHVAEPMTTCPEPVHGMKSLCAMVNRSEATVLDWIRTRGFPAAKVDEEWTADRGMVLSWMMKEVWKCD